MTNKIYTHNTFKGFYPVGTSALIVAGDRDDAIVLLNKELKNIGLDGDASKSDLVLVRPTTKFVRILQDGDY